MKLIKLLIILVISMVISGELFAQDIHFSQFYNAPLTVNPALTGRIAGSFRAGINYRNQWPYTFDKLTSYSTPALYFDMPLRFKDKANVIGAGAYVVNDRSAGGLLTNLTLMASVAYHRGLGKNNNHAISVGVQGGYIQRQVDQSGLIFGSDVADLQNFDPTTTSSRTLQNTSISNFDLQAGIMWNSRISKKLNLYAGVSAYHILEPEHTFAGTTGDDAKLPRRYGINAGADYKITSKVGLLPSFIYMRQVNAQEYNFGLSSSIMVNNNTTLFVGAYYRMKDAINPYLGVDLFNVRVGLSYDANISDLSSTNGAFEVSLSYMAKYIELPGVNPSLYCPRF